MRARIGVGIVALALLGAAVSCAVPIADLGGPTSAALGINDAGVVVGTSDLPALPTGLVVHHAYKRFHDNTVVDLGTLPGHDYSSAARINGAGTAIGISWGRYDPSLPPPPELAPSAVMWDVAGQITDLGSLGPGSEPLDINAAGIIVGESGSRAFVFDPAVGHMVALPDLPGGTQSTARAINDAGEVVGYQYVNTNLTAVRWNIHDGTAEDLSGSFSARFIPFEINNRGSMGGMVAVGPGGTGSPQAAVVLAGTPDPINVGAGDWSVALALNEADTAVVQSLSGSRAYRWQPSTGLVELASAQGSYAWDINERGSVVGQAELKAAFFGVPPVP